ncbi:MAG: M15 family metallopeptidase [Defluviitaleaceae bacterium]|nr:M15 family metallopeptidase [Defluviitaleaceae bacterium]
MSRKKAVLLSTTIAVFILIVIIAAAFFFYNAQQSQPPAAAVQENPVPPAENIENIEIELAQAEPPTEVDQAEPPENGETSQAVQNEPATEVDDNDDNDARLPDGQETEVDDEFDDNDARLPNGQETDEPEEIPEDETAIFIAEPIPTNIVNLIYGSSFVSNDYIALDELSYLTITHVDFDGETQIGNMIVAAALAEEVLDIFREIYASGFPIAQMLLIDHFNADDLFSMQNNNSSAFNFRYIAETTILSNHAFGVAIDINPVQNPSVATVVWPPAGAAYVDRNNVRPGMIIPGDVVYTAFTSRGWTWGGSWQNVRDYQHFEKTY